MGVSNTPWGVVDANRLLLKDGVGLLTAGGVGYREAGDVVGVCRAVACCLLAAVLSGGVAHGAASSELARWS